MYISNSSVVPTAIESSFLWSPESSARLETNSWLAVLYTCPASTMLEQHFCTYWSDCISIYHNALQKTLRLVLSLKVTLIRVILIITIGIHRYSTIIIIIIIIRYSPIPYLFAAPEQQHPIQTDPQPT